MNTIATIRSQGSWFRHTFLTMMRYNMKIIFAGKFIWFFLAALAFYIFSAVVTTLNSEYLTDADVYSSLSFPALLLVFYPTVFGMQNDSDARILEILFGIPNYRYKVWLIRILMVFVLVFFILMSFASLGYLAMAHFDFFPMVLHLLVQVVFMGSLAFFVSTAIKNGNGTAVTIIVISLVLWALGGDGPFEGTYWDVFLNPYELPSGSNESLYVALVKQNRTMMLIGSVVMILGGLTALQRREKFAG